MNDEFLVEGHITSEQNFTAPSVIDTSENKFGQQENSQTTHHKCNLRSGDRMMAVREQCAAHLSSIREPIIDRQQGKIVNSKTHIVHWVSMHAETVTELTQDLYTKHTELHWQPNRQNTCFGQTCLYFDEEENRWIFSAIISDRCEKIQQRNILSCLEDLQFRAQQLGFRELAIERLPKIFGNISTAEFESVIEITFLRTDIAIIIYDENPVKITQIADLQTTLDDDNLQCGAFFCLSLPAPIQASLSQTSSFPESLSSGNFFPSNRSSNYSRVSQESFTDMEEDVIESSHQSTAISNHETPGTSYNEQASDLIDLSNSADRTISTTPEQSGLDHDNCLQLYFQSRAIRLPIPQSSNSTGTDNLTIDERIELYSNPLYDTGNSIPSPPPLLHRDRFPKSNQADDLNTLPPLQRAPGPGNSCNSHQIEAACDVESIREERTLPQIADISIQKDAKGAQKNQLFFNHNQHQS